MTLPSRILTVVPQWWPIRLQIVKAIRKLAAEYEDDRHQRREREEYAATQSAREHMAEEIRAVARECALLLKTEVRKAGFNPNEPRVPAGNPDGGQWTREEGSAASDGSEVVSDATTDETWIPGAQYAANGNSKSNAGPPAIPPEQPATPQAVNTLLKAAAYFLAGAALAGEPAGEFILVLEAADWLSQYLPWVYSYLDPPKTLDELQRAALDPQPGYDIHHIVEQTPAAQDGFPWSMIDGSDNLVLIPTLKHWQISAWYSTANPNFDWLSPRDYLRGKDWDERVRVGKMALILYGVLQP